MTGCYLKVLLVGLLLSSIAWAEEGGTDKVMIKDDAEKVEMSAVPGKLFTVDLADHGIPADQSQLQVALPKWLHHDPAAGELAGVPGQGEVGNYTAAVDRPGTQLVFVIAVTAPASPLPSSDPLQEMACGEYGTNTVASLQLEGSLPSLQAHQRTSVVRQAARTLGLASSMLSLIQGELLPPELSVLVTGPGSPAAGKKAQAGRQKSSCFHVQWLVGCGDVQPFHVSLLERVEKEAKAGVLDGPLGFPVAGWQLGTVSRVRRSNSPDGAESYRRSGSQRRRVRYLSTASPTPTVSHPRPTAIDTEPPTYSSTVRTESSTESSTTPTPVPPIVVDPVLSPKASSTTENPLTTESSTTTTASSTTSESTTRLKKPVVPPVNLPGSTAMMTESTTTTQSTTISTTTTQPPPVLITTESTTASTTSATTSSTTSSTTVSTTETSTTTEESTTSSTTVPTTSTPTTSTTTIAPDLDPTPVPEHTSKSKKKLSYNIPMGSVLNITAPRKMHGRKNERWNIIATDTEGRVFEADFWIFPVAKGIWTAAPMEPNVGNHSFYFVSRDQLREVHMRRPFRVEVTGAPEAPVAFELGAKFGLDYDDMVSSPNKRIKLLSAVAGAFGDSNPSSLLVTSFRRGSVEMGWSNTSVSQPEDGACPVHAVRSISSRVMGEDGQMRPEVREKLETSLSELRPADKGGEDIIVGDLSLKGRGSCDGLDLTPSGSNVDEPRTEKTENRPSLWLTIAVPAAVILVMVVIAVIIACCLHRRRRRKAYSPDFNDTFVRKGAPVIFMDELEAGQTASSSRPLMLPDDSSSPPPPPHYPGESETSAGEEAGINDDEEDLIPAKIRSRASSALREPPPYSPVSTIKRPH